MSDLDPLVVGTAGHVDHGKTTLVGALTGRDTDRLAEEKRRGLSIELGYAPLTLPSGRRLSVVDAPGHESFVRTMVAGATGIDMFLLCIAADDGVMPQTREHAEILRALAIEHGVVAITRSDLTDPETARREALKLLPGVATVAVAAPSGAGIDELLATLDRIAASAPGRGGTGEAPILHIDRSFTLRGRGTIVTGTLWAGTVTIGDELVVQPGGQKVRVRSLQVHDEPMESAVACQRVALGLSGIARRSIGRGDVVCGPDVALRPTHRLDVEVRLPVGAPPLDDGEWLHAHHGTRHATAKIVLLELERIEPGSRALCQLRCRAPLVPRAGDRLVLRATGGMPTGAVVLDPFPPRHRRGTVAFGRLAALRRGEIPPADSGEPGAVSTPAAEPAAPEPDERARALAALLRADGERPRSHNELEAALGLDSAGLTSRLRTLERSGEAVRVSRNLHFHRESLDRLVERAMRVLERDDSVTVAGLRDELSTTRRYALAVLEHLDALGMTIRHGDDRVLRGRRRPASR